ncbi:MAG: hypothetical protein H5T59_11965 [Anaerolineae bacterium]|nr:hypothetical protein [Anaerolineae bacterium]
MVNGAVKAGLVGAAIAVGLQIVGLIPCIGSILSCLGLLALAVAVGVLAVRMATEPIPSSGSAAGAGAIAGAITGAVSSVAGTLLAVLRIAVGFGMGTAANWYRYLPPETLRQMREYGVDPRLLASPRVLGLGTVVGGCFSLAFSVLIFAALAAVAALVYHSSREGTAGPETPSEPQG